MAATLKTISAALKLIDTKKENLKKAYDELHANNNNSSLLSSFPLSWSDLDSHFTSRQNSLTRRFHLLESSQSIPIPSSSSSSPPHQNPKAGNHTSLMPRHELVALCEKMDGKGLRNYIIENFKGSESVEAELQGALRSAPDPASMVLDSLDGFLGNNGMKEVGLRKLRRSCVLLLEQLRIVSPEMGSNVREKARKLAAEWKGKLINDRANTLGALGFLHFVLAYGLVSEVSHDELVDFSVKAANNKEVPELCRVIGLADKVPDIVQKLIDVGKHVLAVKYIFEFNLADKIPPVTVLKACVNEAKKLAERILQEGKPPTEATAREIHALKSVMKVIESYKLESQYPLASLEQRIEQLKKKKADKKRPAPASAAKPQPQPQPQQPKQQKQQHQQQKNNNQKQKQRQKQHGGNKHPRISAPVVPTAAQKNVNSVNLALHQYQQPLIQPTGLLSEHQNPYMGSQTMPYGIVGPSTSIPPYTVPSGGGYGLASVPMGSSGNPSQIGSHLYPSELNVQSGYYDRTTAYGGLPHYYHPSYCPQ